MTEAAHSRITEDTKALGDFRRANPQEAPKAFQRVEKAAKSYHKKLANFLNSFEDREGRELKFALLALKNQISKWGDKSPEAVAPQGMEIFKALGATGDSVDYDKMLTLLRKYLKSNELGFGIQRVQQ